MVVADDDAVEPVRQRGRTDEDEQVLRIDGLRLAGAVVAQGQPLQVIGTVRLDDLSAGPDLNRGDVIDLLDQVVRHRLCERVRPYEDRRRAGSLGEIDGRLTSGVRAADDEDVLVDSNT